MKHNASVRMMSARTNNKPLRVVLLAVPPLTGIDIIGPAEVFAAANRLISTRGPGYEIELVTTGRDKLIPGPSGLSLLAQRHYRQLHQKIDTLLVMGGAAARKSCDEAFLSWLRRMEHRVRRLGSVCTGALLLAEAGLLNGRRATTHWMFTREMAEQYPQIMVDINPIWVQDGHIYTSAGATAGMDLCLALVEEDYGGKIALEVARFLVLFLRRSGGQAQFSVALSAQAPKHKSLRELQVWIAENLSKTLSVESLAAHVSMSPRNFARVFMREIGVTPAHYVNRLRLEAARHELEQTEKSVEQIAGDCGFGSAELMRRAFLRTLGITPSQYRVHFSY